MSKTRNTLRTKSKGTQTELRVSVTDGRTVVIPRRPASEPIVRVARTSLELAITQPVTSGAPTVTDAYGNSSFNLRDLVTGTQSWSALSAQYDQFRVKSVEVDYFPYASPQNTNSNQQVTAPTGLAYDLDNVSLGAPSAQQILDYAQMKAVDLFSRWNIRFEIPGMAFGSSATGYAAPCKWFDTSSPQQLAGCFRIASITPSGSTAVPWGGATSSWVAGALVWSLTMEYLQAV
jgi:hypothetical protein